MLNDKEGKIPLASSSVFRTKNNFESVESIDIEKEEETFLADAAGFGFLLIHRSVITKLLEKFGNRTNFFHGSQHLGEDIAFSKILKIAIYL